MSAPFRYLIVDSVLLIMNRIELTELQPTLKYCKAFCVPALLSFLDKFERANFDVMKEEFKCAISERDE